MVQNILHTLGGGSGINTRELVDQLVELQSVPETTRLDNREKQFEAQISDFGLLRSSLSKLESAVGVLGNGDTFNAKSLSVPETSLIALTKLESSAAAGNYQIKVEQIAQSQSLSSATFAASDAEIGTGSLTIRLGGWNAALDTFTPNEEVAAATITIDDSNNTLEGLRDAINGAGLGVQASVVSDGDSFRLLLTGPSGASNELEIVATEDPADPGLAGFNFNGTDQALTQQQEGKNAQLRVNGLLVERSSNTIKDVISGLEFDVYNSSPTEVINLSINEDRSVAETAIRDFVAAYNTFLTEVEQLTGVNEETGEFGSLRNDSLADNLVDTVRRFLGAAVPGMEEGFTVLANLGIQTNLDGSLEINEDPERANTNFRAAMDQHFDLVKKLFVPQFSSDNSDVKLTAYGARTQPGSYEVVISQNATQGTLNADPIVATFPLDTTGKDYSFDMSVNGKAVSVALPDATVYNSADELAAALEDLINGSASLQGTTASVMISHNIDTGALEFTSSSYGSSSNVAITAVGADAAELGLGIASGTSGLDVKGTIDGKEGFGLGQVLLPAIGTPAEGLKMIIKPGSTTATITFSRGFGGGLSGLINTFLANNGLIAERETNITSDMEDLKDDRETLERRTEAFRARLESQFLAMEMIVRSLNNTGSFLDGINDRLPFTAPKG